jgi:hypothetical protein
MDMLYYFYSRNVVHSGGFVTHKTHVSVPKLSWCLRTMGLVLSLAGLLAFAGALPARADSLDVSYTTTNLGGGLYEYAYTLSGYDLLAGDDLAIYFPLATSANLTDLGTGGADYTTFVFQPDPSIPADGEFDAIANVDNPSLATVLDTSFLYSGAGTPGAQDFTLYDADYNVISTGETLAATPEPLPLLLLCTGILAIYALRQRQRLQA